jgi:hypothetical protein
VFWTGLIAFAAFFASAGLAAAGTCGVGDAFLPRRETGKGQPETGAPESFFIRKQGSVGCQACDNAICGNQGILCRAVGRCHERGHGGAGSGEKRLSPLIAIP